MQRDRAYYRKMRNRTIRQKCTLLKKLGGDDLLEGWIRGDAGRLAKGKIHCSCRVCRSKSYDALSCRDRKHKISAVEQLREAGVRK